MKPLLAFLGLLTFASPVGAQSDTRLFEMRVYYAAEGKLEALHKRFRDHTLGLFAKHGMTSLGYFTPTGPNPERKLVYFLAYPDRSARDASWKAFLNDADWKAAKAESERQGTLVARIENTFLVATDFSPRAQPGNFGQGIFELRTYTAAEGRLSALQARFREHTLGLFRKHGMTNISYWTMAEDQKDGKTTFVKGSTLIYLLAHGSEAAAKKSFEAFRADPDWIAAKAASEQKAGGSLTIPDGVRSEFLVPTDYSPLK